MRIPLDTNVIVRNANRADPQQARVAGLLEQLVREGAELCLAPQVLFEYWVAATRPVQLTGLGLTPAEARRSVELFRDAFVLLPEPTELIECWLDLCSRYAVRGRQAHDARLVAFMMCHALDRLVTLNATDFARYSEIQCLGPA